MLTHNGTALRAANKLHRPRRNIEPVLGVFDNAYVNWLPGVEFEDAEMFNLMINKI